MNITDVLGLDTEGQPVGVLLVESAGHEGHRHQVMHVQQGHDVRPVDHPVFHPLIKVTLLVQGWAQPDPR